MGAIPRLPFCCSNFLTFKVQFQIEVEKVEIYVVEQKTKGYIETKPLHGSQTQLRKFKDGYKFYIKVIPNYELESLILSFGEKIKILSPDSLQKRVKNRLQKSIKHYE